MLNSATNRTSYTVCHMHQIRRVMLHRCLQHLPCLSALMSWDPVCTCRREEWEASAALRRTRMPCWQLTDKVMHRGWRMSWTRGDWETDFQTCKAIAALGCRGCSMGGIRHMHSAPATSAPAVLKHIY